MVENTYYKPASGVQERIVITGDLILTTPTGLGNGDRESLTDIALRRDEVSNRPVLPGTSLAGALRDYVYEWLPDSDNDGLNQALVGRLFGAVEGETSRQSWLFIDDAFGVETGVEIRDGVAIDPKTRVAEEGKKFDIELLAAGTCFPLRLEFWRPASEKGQPEGLLQVLALALIGLANGDIRLGARKRRGFGECKVQNWKVYRYDMSTVPGILSWLAADESKPAKGENLLKQLGLSKMPTIPSPNGCRLVATFEIDGTLLIRSAPSQPKEPGDESGKEPDMAHLRNLAGQPVLPGTSLAGALRARAERIARVQTSETQAKSLVDSLFGPRMEDENSVPQGSRIWIKETPVRGREFDLVQHRVKLDRFTGGSYPGALFSQQPVFGGQVEIDLTIRRPEQTDVGLLLLLLKDLWTGSLPLGGEASVGRGRLKGQVATLTWQGQMWEIKAGDDENAPLIITGDRETLETAVKSLQPKQTTTSAKEVQS